MLPPAPDLFSTTTDCPEVLRELLRHDARRRVGAASGCEADRERNRAIGERLPDCDLREGESDDSGEQAELHGAAIISRSAGGGSRHNAAWSFAARTTSSSPAAAMPRCAPRITARGRGLSVLVVEVGADRTSAAATAATRATCAPCTRARCDAAHRRLPRGGVLAGPPQGHRRPDRRDARAHDDPRSTEQHVPWMQRHGVRFQAPLGGTLQLARTNAFFLGGGKALMNAYYRARRGGWASRSPTTREVVRPQIARRARSRRRSSSAEGAARRRRSASAVVAASGGFEANLEWLREALGPHAPTTSSCAARRTTADACSSCCSTAARSRSATRRRAIAWRSTRAAPKFDGGIVTRVDAVPLGIVVNRDAQRFYDEGEDFWPKRYAIWGRLIARQPDQIAYAIIDAKAIGRFMPPVFPPIVADTIAGAGARARARSRRAGAHGRGVQRRRAARAPSTTRSSTTAAPRASRRRRRHWARAIDTPPFLRLPAAARASRSPISAWRSTNARACCRRTASRRPTSSPRARSWRATCSARATSPASAWRSGRRSGASRARRPRAMSAG